MRRISRRPVVVGSSLTPKYVTLDGCRFLAASGVVLFHFDTDFHLGLAKVVPAVAQLTAMVDFFFMLSGFVIATGYINSVVSWTDYRRFLRARLARIYPLHLATLVMSLGFVAMAAALGVSANHPEIIAMSGLPANFLLLHAWGVLDHPSFNVPSWSISAEWFVYLTAPVFFTLVRRAHLLVNLALLILFTSMMIAIRSHAGLGHWMDAAYDFGMLRAVPTFFSGVMLANILARTSINWTPSWWSVHAAGVLAICLLGTHLPRELVLIVFALLIVAAALADRGGAPTILKGELLSSLGKSSYGLYMLHVLLSLPILFFLRRLQLIDTGWSLIAACATYIIAIVLSLVSYRFFETPMRRLLTAA